MRNLLTSPRTLRLAALALIAAATLAGGGCAGGPFSRLKEMETDAPTRQISETELADRLHRISATFSRTAQSATDDIVSGNAEPEVVRRALAWRLHAIHALRTSVLAFDPQAAFLDVWVFLVQQRQFFEGVVARGHFGDASERVLEGIAECQREIETLAGQFLTPVQIESARKEVEAFAAKYPMTDAYARSGHVPTLDPAAESADLAWLVSIPMAPFTMFSGIDAGAAAIRDFTAVADRFARRVERTPQEAAWELQLVLHDAEYGPAAQRTLAGLEQASAASASIAATAERLPEEVRRALDASLSSLDERHARIDASLAAVGAVVERAEGAVRTAEGMMKSAEKPLADANATAKSLTDAGEAWKGTIDAYRAMSSQLFPPRDPAATEPPARPFDILEYERTASELTGTARELRGVVDSLRGLLGETDSSELAGRVSRVAGESAAAARVEGEALVDHLFVRALQLAVAVAALGVASLLAVRRWGRGRPVGAQAPPTA